MPNAFVRELARDVFDTLDHMESMTYTPVTGATSTINVALARGIQRVGFESDVMAQHDEVSFLTADVATPKRGDTIYDGTYTYTFVSPITNNGVVAIWVVAAS